MLGIGCSYLEFGDFLREFLGVAADEEIPFSETAPMVHGRNPAVRSLVFGVRILVGLAFDFQNEDDAVCQFDQEIGLVNARIAVKLIRDVEFEAVVSGVTGHDSRFGESFQLEYGGLLP